MYTPKVGNHQTSHFVRQELTNTMQNHNKKNLCVLHIILSVLISSATYNRTLVPHHMPISHILSQTNKVLNLLMWKINLFLWLTILGRKHQIFCVCCVLRGRVCNYSHLTMCRCTGGSGSDTATKGLSHD